MADVFSKEKRSEIMSVIKSTNTKPELFVRKLIHSMGYRFRLHDSKLPGKPDLVFKKYKKVIFIHGCFWHGHRKCKRSYLPNSNKEFWKNKITKNKKRDIRNYKLLSKLGWEYLIIWQCDIRKEDLKKIINNFLKE